MEEKRDYSKECGIRCRQIRMSKGMSQQALAEAMNVTAQAISKWEKEGIGNIDHIMRLSNVLGQDITADQFDQDGSLGEVGKEILRIIIEAGGYAEFENFELDLYGMKSDRISNELFKLERIGTVVREQFKDFSGKERDAIFITAKGVIAYKNTVMFPNADQLSSVVTLDERLEDGCSSFQDLIDTDRVTKFLMELNHIFVSSFRCDYIRYLFKNFYNPIIKELDEATSIYNDSTISHVLCGESCYIDLMRRMAQGIDVKEFGEAIDDYLTDSYAFEDYELYEMECDDLEYQAAGLDQNNMRALRYFCNVIENMPDFDSIYYDEDEWDSNSNDPSVQSAISTMRMAEANADKFDDNGNPYGFKGFVQKMSDNEEAFFGSLGEKTKKNSNLWFTEEEVKKYIKANILSPETEDEKKIDEGLHKLWETNPQTLTYYYSFPKSWEENGLAQLIRDLVGVPAINECV